jgi:23S rRNA pseudouridine1911/1915/1917 synthase
MKSAPVDQKLHLLEWKPSWEGKRLKEILAAEFPSLGSRAIVMLVRNNLVEADEETLEDLDAHFEQGTVLRVDLRHGIHGKGKPKRPMLRELIGVRHDDDFLVVVSKAPGIVVQPVEDETTGRNPPVVELLKHYWRSKNLPVINPILVHRLDKETSGLMVLAKNVDAARELQKQAAGRHMERRYVAIVEGTVEDDRGTWQSFMGRGEDGHRQNLPEVERNAKGQLPHGVQEAITHFKVIERIGRRATLLELELETGRTHQIRIHCAEAGHPVVSDGLYVKLAQKRFPDRRFGAFKPPPTRLMLHALRLKFRHPALGRKYLTFREEPPEAFEMFLEQVRKGPAPSKRR